MKVTMNNLNTLLKPHGLELVKGNGYFYFVEREGCQVQNIPDSIYSYALNHGTWKQWARDIEDAIEQSKREI